MNNLFILFCLFTSLLCVNNLNAQETDEFSAIINKISKLEHDKDPKCYATANRLENFIYGTPLDEKARNFKINIQKELIYHIKKKASILAFKEGGKKIELKHLKTVIQNISSYQKLSNGDYTYSLDSEIITITNKDFKQYSSISYAYRSILSVKQDILFLSESNFLSFSEDSLTLLNDYINLITLVTLKLSDIESRKNNKEKIQVVDLKKSWSKLLTTFKKDNKSIEKINYLHSKPNASLNSNHILIKEIIKQKNSSYKAYNNLNNKVFLRNIQVYFAKQKWPIDNNKSVALKNFFLESLIAITKSIIENSDKIATSSDSPLIRIPHIQTTIHTFLPSQTNSFEDVTFFPNNDLSKITIESYDLDAFRDGGFHWKVLEYCINDIEKSSIKSLDPNAAELLVEGIAQFGILSLRFAGKNSHKLNKTTLDFEDIKYGFSHIQKLINEYDFNPIEQKKTSIISSVNNTNNNSFAFEDVSKKTKFNFTHKSSDWLNRHIRSYSFSKKEETIKLAIPPAFGGSGVACEDINNDGFTDILILSGFGNKLFLNSRNNTFIDITSKSKINSWNELKQSFSEPRQPIIADFDNDGKQDIFISYVNDQHKIYKNTDGIHFKDFSATANLGGENAVAGPATTFDYNNDGLLDIFIGYFGNYIDGVLPTLSRDNNNGDTNKLYKNLGNFKFEEVPFTSEEDNHKGWTQALVHVDINQDGWQDIIIGNDFGLNKYYLNTKDGLFKEVSKTLKTDKPSYTMNIGITDLNRDLFPDFYISNIVVMQKDEKYISPNKDTKMKFDLEKMKNIRTIETNDLFLSKTNNNTLENYQLSTNVKRGFSSTGWSWDADFFDFDNDGDEDIYCLNGMNDFSVYSTENQFYTNTKNNNKPVQYAQSHKEKNVFFVNNNGSLTNKAKDLGVDLLSNARSGSYVDFDNDGDLDIVVNNYHEPANFLENKSNNNNNWVKIRLIGNPTKNINLDAIGSSLILNSKSHKNIWREIHSTTGYLSVHSKTQHFGLGQDTEFDLIIKWSNGEQFEINNIDSKKTYTIKYPNLLKERIQ